MKTVTFDVGTEPWDSLVGQVIQANGIGPAPSWKDAGTQADFMVVLGRMSVQPVLDSTTARLLSLEEISDSAGRTILRIRFPSRQNFVRFRIGSELYTANSTIAYYENPSYGSGGRPSSDTLVKEVSVQAQGGADIEYNDVCFPVSEVWITVAAGLLNSIDTVEFDYRRPNWLHKAICLWRRGIVLPGLKRLHPR